MSYIIGVKQESASKGGSKILVDTVREGDLLSISEPRNNFPLRRDAVRSVLIAGGIGITPLLSMARFLDKSSLPYELHYFTRAGEQVAFRGDLEALHGKVILHIGLPRAEIASTIATALGEWSRAQHVYVCGPSAMLESVRTTAAAQGWPDEAIHFEYFKNDKVIDDSSSFEIELARSAMTLHVPSGRTILEIMRENGLTVPSSCEQGACGTCLTTVMEGEVDHQDVYLNDSEKTLQRLHDDLCVTRKERTFGAGHLMMNFSVLALSHLPTIVQRRMTLGSSQGNASGRGSAGSKTNDHPLRFRALRKLLQAPSPDEHPQAAL
jgi:ferredoxin-NADP reductase